MLYKIAFTDILVFMKSKFPVLLIVLSVVLFTSCAALFAKYNRYMTEWQGHKEDEVYLVYGPPMRAQDLEDGRKIIAYDFASSGGDATNFCEVKFILEGGIVSTANYRGNFGAVERFVRGPGNAN
ncbi:hypothetical protein SAMN05661044_02849 [Olivibacter domesticus]|uniref:Uncharacterized protein n=2 Tax=Olivibacter domesticus TaxID=407022 RepID=A0A1H7R644_OLID1|nr:hypothetical protein SAMN05661044_02849 [Olivibacter domesticus]